MYTANSGRTPHRRTRVERGIPGYADRDDWLDAFGNPPIVRRQQWGVLAERRVRLPSGLEVEVGVAAMSWAITNPRIGPLVSNSASSNLGTRPTFPGRGTGQRVWS